MGCSIFVIIIILIVPCLIDPVEFCTSNDRRTGKPIAIQVTSIDISQAVPSQLSDEQFVGTVIQEAKPIKGKNVSPALMLLAIGLSWPVASLFTFE